MHSWRFTDPITLKSLFLWNGPYEKWNSIWATTWQNQRSECEPREDSDQPWHLPSLTRVSAVCMKKAWVLSYPLSGQWRLWSDGRCPGWSESSLGTQSLCWFCPAAAHIMISNPMTKSKFLFFCFLYERFITVMWQILILGIGLLF